jgi:ATP-dependent Lon protease
MSIAKSQVTSSIVPILPLKSTVVFPKTMVPILIGRTVSLRAIEAAMNEQQGKNYLCIVAQKNQNEDVALEDLYDTGTLVSILQVIKGAKGTVKILVEGLCRVTICDSVFNHDNKCFVGVCSPIRTMCEVSSIELESMWRILHANYTKYNDHHKKTSQSLIPNSFEPSILEMLLDTLASNLQLSFTDRQEILSKKDIVARIQFLNSFIARELQIIDTEDRIRNTIQNQIDTAHREYYLNEQLKAIQKELRKEKLEDDYAQQCFEKIKTLGLHGEVLDKIQKELGRLEQMQPITPEASIARTYIDCILSLPWHSETHDTCSILDAKKILDENHYGLLKVKERIIEIIAAQKYSKGAARAAILCLVGPPGVGKTSLGKSIAASLNREFVRIALGGIRDEAEIRGHRRTYIGAMPGKIIHAMKKCTTINPVIMLDEIDKMSHDLHGDPASALLEVLDPEQNKNFIDNYLDVPYDLSRVVFITTANTTDSIPLPLADRMEIIHVSGYTSQEKLMIAKEFLIPEQLKEHKIPDGNIIIEDGAIESVIQEYTRESGVRQLERYIIRMIRKIIEKMLEIEDSSKDITLISKKSLKKKSHYYTITKNMIKDFFKTPHFTIFPNKIKNRIGIATGLAWTEMGGDVLDIEVAMVPGKGNVMLTGQLGEVMQESAQAALTFVKTRIKELGISKCAFTQSDIHIHIPEGATPKDGPSAGITMCAALISALCKIPTKQHVAMTGEITLQGRILEIGGLKEKLLAALVHGYKTILIPFHNKSIYEEIAKELSLSELIIICVDNMDDAIKYIFLQDELEKIKNNKIKEKAAKKIVKNKKKKND